MPGLPSGLLDSVNKTRGSLGPLAQTLMDRFLPAEEIMPAAGIAVGPVKAGGSLLQRILPKRQPTVVQPRQFENLGDVVNYKNEFQPWAGLTKIKNIFGK